MAQPPSKDTEKDLELTLGSLLRAGVIAAAVVVFAGGILYLIRHGGETVQYQVFLGEPKDLCNPAGIVKDALTFRSRGIIQLGLLLLIATPVARVCFSAYAFARLRDYTYVILTLIVLAVLLCSLFIGYFESGSGASQAQVRFASLRET